MRLVAAHERRSRRALAVVAGSLACGLVSAFAALAAAGLTAPAEDVARGASPWELVRSPAVAFGVLLFVGWGSALGSLVAGRRLAEVRLLSAFLIVTGVTATAAALAAAWTPLLAPPVALAAGVFAMGVLRREAPLRPWLRLEAPANGRSTARRRVA